jgi:hypothetical protein
MGALQNIMAWAKSHPLIAGVIVLGVGAAAFLMAKVKPGQTTTADQGAVDAGGASGGGASDMTGLPVTSPDLSGGGNLSGVPDLGGSVVSGVSFANPSDTYDQSFAAVADGSVQAFQKAIRGSGYSSSELTAAAVRNDQLGLLSSIRGAFPDVYSTPLEAARTAQRTGFSFNGIAEATPQADVRRSLQTTPTSTVPTTPTVDLMAQRVQLNVQRAGTGVYYSPDMRGPGR